MLQVQTKKETSMGIAYNRILQKIINEKLQPGTPLREDHLAEEFGFSSTPVREAFRRLEHEGWIQSFPYKGSFLKKFTYDEISDLYLLREAIECIAVGQAIENATEEDWKIIEEALEIERKYIEDTTTTPKQKVENIVSLFSSYIDSHTAIDIDFHTAILRASHSSLLLKHDNTFRTQLNSINSMYRARLKITMERLVSVYDEHTMVYRAMRRGWVNSAEDLIRGHISRARIKCLRELCPDEDSPNP